jgi:ribonucleoside-diphosphate reductase alpha chain
MINTKIYTREEASEACIKYFNGDELAASAFVGKYSLADNAGNLMELTPDDMHRRLARNFARIEGKYANPLTEEEIYDLFKNFGYIIPQGSPMSAIGNDYQVQSASNCFVIPSCEDSYGGILKTDQEQVQLSKRRGGVGHDISNIRPQGLPTKNAAKTTDGIAVFMERFSNTCREVAQGGRRGALMLTINVHHPER